MTHPPLDLNYPERCPLCHVLCDYETGELQHSDMCTVPAHDAAVAAKALRIVESVCMTADGDHLDGESEIPVGEVMRMISEAREVFGIEREGGDR